MLTIKLNRNDVNDARIWVTTAAVGLLPTKPAGKPTHPREYT